MSDHEAKPPPPAKAVPAPAPGRVKPTPVRAATSAWAPPPAVELDLPEASLDVDGARWLVRVLGRSSGAGGTPMLLLGFWPDGSGEDVPELEALLVARTLSGLTFDQLRAAFESASPPPDPNRQRPFFRDSSDRRRR